MKTYTVVIKATIQKTIEVRALDEVEARNLALDRFSLLNESDDDIYSEEVLDVDDVTGFERKVA